MDVFCSRCNETDGVTPDDHPCLRNLRTKFESVLRSLSESAALPPGSKVDFSQDRWSLEKIQNAERELLKIHSHMEAVEEYHSDAANEQSRRANLAGKEIRDVATWVNAARAEMRERLTDV